MSKPSWNQPFQMANRLLEPAGSPICCWWCCCRRHGRGGVCGYQVYVVSGWWYSTGTSLIVKKDILGISPTCQGMFSPPQKVQEQILDRPLRCIFGCNPPRHIHCIPVLFLLVCTAETPSRDSMVFQQGTSHETSHETMIPIIAQKSNPHTPYPSMVHPFSGPS